MALAETNERFMMRDRDCGVVVICAMLALASVFLFITAMLVLRGSISLSAGAFLLQGLQLWGPAMFFLGSAISAVVATGLWMRQNWARRAACFLALALVVGAVPSVSSAVIDFRFAAMAREGVKVLVGVAVYFYLMQPGTKELFGLAQKTALHLTSSPSE